MNFIKELFLKHSLSDMNDEQTRKTLTNKQELRIKIADEIIEHIKQIESNSRKTLWSGCESYRGFPVLNELITKNAKGSFCDKSSYDWFELLKNPYYSLLNFSIDYLINKNMQEGATPNPSDVASFIKKETIVINKENNVTSLDSFIKENIKPNEDLHHIYNLYINNDYKKNGIKNRTLFAISCLVMLANLQELLTLTLKDEEVKNELIELKASYLKKPQFDYRFYEKAIVIYFKDKDDFLNNGQFMYEIRGEFAKANELVNIVKNQINKNEKKLQRSKLTLFKASKTFLNEASVVCLINKSELISQLKLHLLNHFKNEGRTDLNGIEKSRIFFDLLSSKDVDYIEIVYKKGS